MIKQIAAISLISTLCLAEDDPKAKELANIQKEFAGIQMGIGLAMTYKHGRDRVQEASIQDGLVRIDKEENRLPKVMLETHYFFTPEKNPNFGWGPFVAIEPNGSGGTAIGSYAIGGMIGFRRKDQPSMEKGSWNLGVGYIVNTNVKTLGDGINENEPLPGSEKTIRYKYTNQPGWCFIVSFSF